MRFKNRFSNSLAQELSGKNEQPVWPPGRGPQWRGAQCTCIGSA